MANRTLLLDLVVDERESRLTVVDADDRVWCLSLPLSLSVGCRGTPRCGCDAAWDDLREVVRRRHERLRPRCASGGSTGSGGVLCVCVCE